MNELDNVMSLKTLVSVMGGISNSYKQFVSEYPIFVEQIDKAYSDFKNKIESSDFVINKSELAVFTDFEYSVMNYFSKLANVSNCFEVINFLTMFFYSKSEQKEGRYKDLLNRDYSQLNTEIDIIVTECRKHPQPIQEEKELSELNCLLIAVYEEYPLFKKQLPILENAGIITRELGGLHWKRTNETLAFYFSKIKKNTSQNSKWQCVQNLFHVYNLKTSYQNAKEKADEIQEIKGLLNLS